MRTRIAVVMCAVVVGTLAGGDLLACGDKFLSAGRGTRYQRPKDARAASILIYATPGTGSRSALQPARVESALKYGGHRLTTVATLDQLTSILQAGRFDVVLTATEATAVVQQVIGSAPDAAVIVPVDPSSKGRSLLQAVDKAVEQRDRNLKKAHSRT
jgi:hypothetical protein